MIKLILFLSALGWSQEILRQMENGGIWKQQGSLVSVQIVKGKPLRIYVTGREEGKLDLADMKLTVRRMKPYPATQLKAELSSDHYVIAEPVDLKNGTELEVTTEVKQKIETLKFNLKEKP